MPVNIMANISLLCVCSTEDLRVRATTITPLCYLTWVTQELCQVCLTTATQNFHTKYHLMQYLTLKVPLHKEMALQALPDRL